MIRALVDRFVGFVAGIAFAVVVAQSSQAHPHVMVTMRAEVVLSESGAITAIQQSWTFDDAFSAYSVTGLDADKDGILSREELAPLAKINVESLSEYAYFTTLRRGKDKASFSTVSEYHVSFENKALTLHFTLPVEGSFLARESRLTIADPSYFVAFDFANENPVRVKGGKSTCTASLKRPGMNTIQRLSELGEQLFQRGNTAESAANDAATPVTFSCK